MPKILILIFHERSLDEEVLDCLGQLNIQHFTRWHGVTGCGSNGPHLGTPVWPAVNSVTAVVIEEVQKERVLEKVRALQAEFPVTGLRAVALPVLDMV